MKPAVSCARTGVGFIWLQSKGCIIIYLHLVDRLSEFVMRLNFRDLFNKPVLSKQQQVFWDDNGYLILPKFFSKEHIQSLNNEMKQAFDSKGGMWPNVTVDLLEGPQIGKRMRFKDAPADTLSLAHKVNDIFLESEICRSLALDVKLREILNILIEGEATVINSLSFQKGSQQPCHFDTYYMPPPVESKMVVTSICLEDQSDDVGPLVYYPGSHKIPPYRFSHGYIHAIPAEMEAATSYVEQEIQQRGLKTESFVGKAGDVFIWHAQLYHGGLPIKDHQRTRRTLVTHYWREQDIKKYRKEYHVGKSLTGGSYIVRDHQPC